MKHDKADRKDRENPCKDRENFITKIMTHHYHQNLIALSQMHPYSPNLNSLTDDTVPFGLLHHLSVMHSLETQGLQSSKIHLSLEPAVEAFWNVEILLFLEICGEISAMYEA